MSNEELFIMILSGPMAGSFLEDYSHNSTHDLFYSTGYRQMGLKL